MRSDYTFRDADLETETELLKEEDTPELSDTVGKEKDKIDLPVPKIETEAEKEKLEAAAVLEFSGDEKTADALLHVPPPKESHAKLIFMSSGVLLWLLNIIFWHFSQVADVTILSTSTSSLLLLLIPRIGRSYGSGFGYYLPDYYSGSPRRGTPYLAIQFLGWLTLFVIFLILFFGTLASHK